MVSPSAVQGRQGGPGPGSHSEQVPPGLTSMSSLSGRSCPGNTEPRPQAGGLPCTPEPPGGRGGGATAEGGAGAPGTRGCQSPDQVFLLAQDPERKPGLSRHQASGP